MSRMLVAMFGPTRDREWEETTGLFGPLILWGPVVCVVAAAVVGWLWPGLGGSPVKATREGHFWVLTYPMSAWGNVIGVGIVIGALVGFLSLVITSASTVMFFATGSVQRQDEARPIFKYATKVLSKLHAASDSTVESADLRKTWLGRFSACVEVLQGMTSAQTALQGLQAQAEQLRRQRDSEELAKAAELLAQALR